MDGAEPPSVAEMKKREMSKRIWNGAIGKNVSEAVNVDLGGI